MGRKEERVLVTGAGGFIGHHLVNSLWVEGELGRSGRLAGQVSLEMIPAEKGLR